jgi:hypothetical protein
MININPEHVEKAKAAMATAQRVAIKTAKYGSVFLGGVLVGTICGVVLFFTIDKDPI